jgi:hypothetical protein
MEPIFGREIHSGAFIQRTEINCKPKEESR